MLVEQNHFQLTFTTTDLLFFQIHFPYFYMYFCIYFIYLSYTFLYLLVTVSLVRGICFVNCHLLHPDFSGYWMQFSFNPEPSKPRPETYVLEHSGSQDSAVLSHLLLPLLGGTGVLKGFSHIHPGTQHQGRLLHSEYGKYCTNFYFVSFAFPGSFLHNSLRYITLH